MYSFIEKDINNYFSVKSECQTSMILDPYLNEITYRFHKL